jgi:hypothetical protein
MPWPGEIESVTVTWMDGQKETYPCNTIRDDDGVLGLSTVYKGSISLGSNDHVSNERSFPLANIRVYVVNRVS